MMCHNVTRRPPPPPEPPEPPPHPDDEQKDRVIHTRVPESLEAELRKRAQDLGMSVSNLVRNVLNHTFGLVGDVVADGHAVARAVGARKPAGVPVPPVPPVPPPELHDVLAWQPMVLGKNAVCAKCNDLLPKGRDAALGLAEHGGGRVIVCATCFEELRK